MSARIKPQEIEPLHGYACHWFGHNKRRQDEAATALTMNADDFRRLFVDAAATPTPQTLKAALEFISTIQEEAMQ